MSNKAIFLNRDNTLIEDTGYINSPDQINLIDGIAEPLAELKKTGYKLVVISNQSCVANGIVKETVLSTIHGCLEQLLAKKGVHLDKIYYCPFHPDGTIEKYRKISNLRKPSPGMMFLAADEMDIDLKQSWMVGSKSRDVQAGINAGCKTILIDNPTHTKAIKPGEPQPDFYAINMKEVVNIIRKHQRSSYEAAVSLKTDKIKIEPVKPQETKIEPVKQEETKTEQPPLKKQKNTDEQLLTEILAQLKSMQRHNMFDEFSVTRLLAGIFQVVVWFCLLISIWFLMSPAKEDGAVLISIGFAAVFQLMALTFYLMQGRR